MQATTDVQALREQSPRSLKVLRSESGGFPICADYTSVAAKMMTIEERRRMLTGDILRKRTAAKAWNYGCTCVLWLGKCSLYKEGWELTFSILDDISFMNSVSRSCGFLASVYCYTPHFLFIFEKRWHISFPLSGAVRCVWINSTALSVSSLVWALQLHSYLELN